jgi:3-methyladenine DNA glycosylase AlkD
MTESSFDPSAEAVRLRRRLERLAARPAWGKRKIFLRIGVPNLRAVVREQWHSLESVDDPGLEELAHSLWDGVTYDEMYLAVELLRLRPSLVSETLIDRLRASLDNRAVTDDLASVVRAWIAEDPAGRFPALERWTGDQHAWSRRLGLLGTVLLSRRGEESERTLELVSSVLEDRRQPVITAVSTALRELTKSAPRQVEAFVEAHSDDLPARVRLEVWNKLRFGRKDGKPRRAPRGSTSRARRSGAARGRRKSDTPPPGAATRRSTRRSRRNPDA